MSRLSDEAYLAEVVAASLRFADENPSQRIAEEILNADEVLGDPSLTSLQREAIFLVEQTLLKAIELKGTE